MEQSRRSVVVVLAIALLASGCFGTASSPSPEHTPPTSPTVTVEPTTTPTEAPTPTGTATATATASPTPTSSPSPSPVTFVTVTVRAGDTLGSIASEFDTTWQSLVYWNRTEHPSLDPTSASYDPNRLEIGWTLRLQPGVVIPYDAPLPATPTPGPTAKPTATGTLVTNGSRATNRVALTLDMGGRVGDAIAIMTWLRDHNVRATIFMTGAMADSTATDAGRQVLSRVDARTDLFDLGNHSYTHPHMTTLTAKQMADELRTTEAAIARHATTSPRPFFRPPFGEWNTTLVNTAASVGYGYSVMWDVDTIDWKPIADGGPTAQLIVDKVLARAQGGSIVLMHLGGYETLDALPGIVDGLRSRGFEFVTLGQMLGG